MLRQKTALFEKLLLVVWQETGGKWHKVEFQSFGEKMWKAVQVVSDTKFTVRLNHVVNPDDTVANDIKYHCMGSN